MALGTVGIIGGSGVGEALGTLANGQTHEVETPFGRPSGPIITAELEGLPVALLARHGPGHLLNPTQVPYRANIYALKSLGVTHILASAAVGSLREEIAPRDVVVPDQVIDRTVARANTFYDELAVHVEFASPFCPTLRAQLLAATSGLEAKVHTKGTLVCMEGPAFSTRAESELYRSWGGDLVGMTVLPEAKLAREAEICYAMVCLPTDYDCWRPAKHALHGMELLQEITGNLKAARTNAFSLIQKVLPALQAHAAGPCGCQSALELGLFSDRASVPAKTRQKLKLLLSKYLP